MSRLIGLVLLGLLCSSTQSLAHGDEELLQIQKVRLQLNIEPIAANFIDANNKPVTLTQAYLSLFSVEMIRCPTLPKHVKRRTSSNLLNWIIPAAYANHGVRFDKPTQIPIMQSFNLLTPTTLDLGELSLPVGHYCEMNITLAKNSKPLLAEQGVNVNRYSLYLTTNADAKINANYAYGKNTFIALDISDKSHELTLAINPAKLFTAIDFGQSESHIARKILLNFHQQVELN